MSQKGDRLADYVRKKRIEIVTSIDGEYGHMGATLTDAVLQAGINYATVVRPRARRLLEEYPRHKTTSAFAELLDSIGAKVLLDWDGGPKLGTLIDLTKFLIQERIETVEALRHWIVQPGNIRRLQNIKGIKDKTSYYIAILVGVAEVVAVDRHIRAFLKVASVEFKDDDEAQAIVADAADIMGVRPSHLDHTIWRYMSERDNCDDSDDTPESS